MLIGIQGKMGAGKTWFQTILAQYLHEKHGVPLLATYDFKKTDYARLTDAKQLFSFESGVIAWDEIWISLDARLWTDNVFVTRFINQTRKKKIILLYTTQHIRQVEMRVRNGTDVLIHCEKKGSFHQFTFVDWQYQTIGRRLIVPKRDMTRYFDLYDTYEVLEPITMGKPQGKGKSGQNWTTQKKYRTDKKGKILDDVDEF